MENKIKVSIIIPVYNTEIYLRQCLDSVINQTLKEIEIIVVNDGSTDNSLKIIKEYANKDKRIIVINKKNGGVSETRNRGLDICRGEYIQFIDSDDWIDNNMLENMYNIAVDNKLDIVMCGYKNIVDDKKYNNVLPLPNVNNIINKEEIIKYLINSYESKILWFVWRNIYKTELLKSNNIKFKPNLKIGEDSIFNLECFLEAKKMMVINQYLYNHAYNPNSLIGLKYKDYLLNNLNIQYKEKINIYKKYSLENLVKDDINKNFIKHQLPMCIGNEINNVNDSLIHNIKIMKKYEFFDDIIKDNSIKIFFDNKYTFKEKVRFMIIKYNFLILFKVMYK